MNRKINTLCFIFLFLFLISAVSATDCENETQKTISKSNADDNHLHNASNEQTLQASDFENSTFEQSNCKNLTSAKITKKEAILKVANVTMHYNDGHKLIVYLKDENKKPMSNVKIKITVGGSSYYPVTNKKGIATLNLNLKPGNYEAVSTFAGTKLYKKQSVKSTVIIKSTIKSGDLKMYYRSAFSYSAKFYDENESPLKNTPVKFKINGRIYGSKTNNYGIAKLSISLKPGKYSITSINPKTVESITNTITIYPVIKTNDLTINYGDTGEFKVKILNSNGKASANKNVTLKVNGETYIKKTDTNGQISLPIDLDVGQYTITTTYNHLQVNNKITVNKVDYSSSFRHVTIIPDYINVTLPQVFPNEQYSVNVGVNGTVKMPKIEIFTVQVESKTYQFATGKTGNGDAVIMGQKSYLVPFNGGAVLCCSNNDDLIGDGIMITRLSNSTKIEYRSKTNESIELFGFYADKGLENSEILTYAQNDKIMCKVSIQTQYFDETGVKYSLAKLYNRVNTDFAYYEITDHISDPVKFTNTGKPVTYSYFGNNIVGYCSQEEIKTEFIINGKEELEKTETISYGLGEKYRRAFGFEVLQAYTIIASKVSKTTLENWISAYSPYLNRYGMMNLYGMHLASLETAWLADALADSYAKEFNVNWMRGSTLTILGGINLEDTYLNILNADMGMSVKGNEKNVILFRLLNSLNLPNVEDYVLSPVSERYMDNTTNSLDNVFQAILENKFSIAQLGDLIYVFSQDNSAIILNITSGVASVIHSKNNSTYKGSSIATSRDCCSVGILPQDIIAGIRNSIKIFAPGIYMFSNELNKTHPLSVLGYMGIKFVLEKGLGGFSSACIGLLSTMTLIQTGGTMYRDNIVNEKEWHKVMDTLTFTRPGYLQGKKVYNIPNENGGYDYVEVKINDDLTLDRNDATYISNGKTKQLTKEETYQYFCDDYWTPFSMPEKYWDKSWWENEHNR
ncbi:hypothetical protein [Methanobrevibacter sp.]|uniref:hypothetical protein n=1 Tax=Methanobrevibacter sp. TaxID=66852 RepID=UPI00386DACA4